MDGEVERCELARVEDPGVNVDVDTDQEQHTLDVGLLDGQVQKVPASHVKLSGQTVLDDVIQSDDIKSRGR